MVKFKVDKSGRSNALYLKERNNVLLKDLKYLETLTNESKKDNRICFHKDKKSKLHIMINCLTKKKIKIPEMHINKDEFYYILKGKLELIIYSSKKKIKKKIILGPKNRFFYLKNKTIHTTVSITKTCTFLECRTGPFKRKDTIQY